MFRLFFFVLLCVCSGLVSSGELSSDERDALIARIEGRWLHVEQRDFERGYEFESLEYKKVFPKALYVGAYGFSVDWKLLKVIEVKGVSDIGGVKVASVETEVETKTVGTNLNIIPIVKQEKWLHIDGEWWHSFGG